MQLLLSKYIVDLMPIGDNFIQLQKKLGFSQQGSGGFLLKTKVIGLL